MKGEKQMTYNKKSVEDIEVSGKKVLVRCDFNVPLKDGVITSDKRIVEALPTIKYLLDKGAKVVIVEDLISTGMSSLAAKNALVNAGANIMGMVAIFSYNFNQSRKAFENADVELTTLSNYDTLIEVASETGYVKESDKEVLKEWRFSPSTWGKTE